QPGEEFSYPQVVGAHALDGADRAAQDVVAAPELTGALDGDHVLGLLHHADHRRVATYVPADATQCLLGDVAAGRAEADLRLDLHQGLREAPYVGRFRLEDVEGDPLRALGTDAGQPTQLVDQVLDHAFVQR